MADEQVWSVALFGHYKPRFYLQDKITGKTIDALIEEPTYFDSDKYKLHNVSGWQKRCEPGDIVAFRPIEEEGLWTPRERMSFLIVTLENLTHEQIASGIIEPNYDLNSYEEYNPMNFDDFEKSIVDSELEAEKENRKIKKPWKDKSVEEKNKEYDDYIIHEKEKCVYPRDYFNKRRMKITLEDLDASGIDLIKMLDRNQFYSPKSPVFSKTGCFDKLKVDKVKSDAKLNRIERRII